MGSPILTNALLLGLLTLVAIPHLIVLAEIVRGKARRRRREMQARLHRARRVRRA